MKFNKESAKSEMAIPEPLLVMTGIQHEKKATMRTCENAIVVLKGNLTAMELISTVTALQALTAELTVHLAKSCGPCRDCEDCVVQGWDDEEDKIHIPQYLLDEADFSTGAKLAAEINKEDGTIIVSEADYDNDLSDVPQDFLDLLIASGVCLAELEERLMVGDVVYEG